MRAKTTRLALIALIVLAALALSSCMTLRDPEASQEFRADVVDTLAAGTAQTQAPGSTDQTGGSGSQPGNIAPLPGNPTDQTGVSGSQPGSSISQTFISRRPGLNGLQMWISIAETPPDLSQGILLELFHSGGEGAPLASVLVSAQQIKDSYPVAVDFPAQHDPANTQYLLKLTPQAGTYRIYGRSTDNYAQGEAWRNGLTLMGDLAFRLSYSYDLSAAMQDAVNVLKNAWLLLPLLLSLWLPGSVLLHALVTHEELKERLDGWEIFAVSLALSLAVIPLFFLWTTAAGVHLTQRTLLILVALLLAGKVWQWWTAWQTWRQSGRAGVREQNAQAGKPWQPRATRHNLRQVIQTGIRLRKPQGYTLALLAVTLLTLVLRGIMARDLAAPPWVDAVHHGVITRLIMEQGALPGSYEPLIPSNNAGYHPGYHTVMAVFSWLSGLEIQYGMLILGQVLNALAVLAVYLFAKTITGSRTAGVLAALGCGVFTPMPAYLLSWGRYTQLTALLILPAAHKLLTTAFESLDTQEGSPAKLGLHRPVVRWLLLAAVASAGMALVHYRVLAFFAFLVIAEWAVLGARTLITHSLRKSLLQQTLSLAAAALLAILLLLPWWPETLRSLIAPSATATAGKIAAFSDFSWNYLTSASGTPVMITAALGLLIALLLQRWFATSLILWLGLLVFSANLGVFGLPGASLINNTSVEILLYIPLCTLAGYALSELYSLLVRLLPGQWLRLAQGGCLLLLASASLYAAPRLVTLLNPVTLLVRQADLPAIQWAAEHIPQDETVLINPFSWGYGLYAGNDGGYWLAPLAGRKTLPPPVLYGLGDQENWENVSEINARIRTLIDASGDTGSLAQAMKQAGVRYLLLGVRGGVFSAEMLERSQNFSVVYNRDGAWIFEVR